MKKTFTFLFAPICEQYRRQKFRAAVKRLPVYEIERLAYTDFANVPPVNSSNRKPLTLSVLKIWRRIRRQIRKRSALNL